MTSLSRLYSKDSFDSFGDDLCELVLSYLTFEDKLKFECVSKQWKRSVCQKQHEIDFNYALGYSTKVIEKIFINYPNIRSIVFKDIKYRKREEVFELIVKYCHNLTQIETHFHGLTQNTINEFCHKFGSKLKKIKFISNINSNVEVLKLCLNLKALDVKKFNDMSVLFNGTELLVNKLSDISFTYSSNDCNRIGIFCENYKNRLESIEVRVGDKETQNILLNGLKRLSKLKSLVITGFVLIDNSFVNYLHELSNKCLELKKIELKTNSINNEMIAKLFKAFNSFKRLKRLKVFPTFKIFVNFGNSYITSEALNECNNLTQISINILITDEFFNDIHKNLPKLQHIHCSKAYITKETFNSLSKLSNLQTIYLNNEYSVQKISESAVVLKFIENYPKIKSINIKTEKLFKTENND